MAICSSEGNGGGGGPMKFGDPVILIDEAGVEHRGAITHTNTEYPDWVRVKVTDLNEVVAPKIGDDDIPTLVTDLKQYIKIAVKSDKPVAGQWAWRPVPAAIPMSAPTGSEPKPPKGV